MDELPVLKVKLNKFEHADAILEAVCPGCDSAMQFDEDREPTSVDYKSIDIHLNCPVCNTAGFISLRR